MQMPYPHVRVPGAVKSRSWTPSTGSVEGSEERLLVAGLLRVVFFIPHDHVDIAAGVSHALEIYLRAVEGGSGALSEYTCCDWDARTLDEQGLQLIRRTLQPRARRFFEDYSPEEAVDPEKAGAEPYVGLHGVRDSGFGFSYHARLPWRETPPGSVSVLRMTLPLEYLETQGAARVRELVVEMASRLPFASGHAGLALDIAYPRWERLDLLWPLIFRHPGFDIRDATVRDNMGTRVDGIHWLNFLGQPVLEEFGGVAGLRGRLKSSSISVEPMDGARALVSLGPEPEAGDLTRGQTLPAYRELARLFAPKLEPFAWAFLRRQGRVREADLLREWWRRFFD